MSQEGHRAGKPRRCTRVGSLLTASLMVLGAFTTQVAAQTAYRTNAFCLPTRGVAQTSSSITGITSAQACIDRCRTAPTLCRFATFLPRLKRCVISSRCDRTMSIAGSTVYQVTVQQPPQGSATWSAWTFQSCSKTCGTGVRIGTRRCGGSGRCPGQSTKAEACNTSPCRSAASWSTWTFGSCSKTCGGGVRTGARTCTGTGTCTGPSTKTENCNTAACPAPAGTCLAHGTYSAWSDWSPCCEGTRGKVRKCSVTYTRTGITTPDTSVYFESETCTSTGSEKCGKYRAFGSTGLAATDFKVGVTDLGEMRLAYMPTDMLTMSAIYLHPWASCTPSFTGCAYGFEGLSGVTITTIQDDFFWIFYPANTLSYLAFREFNDLASMPPSIFAVRSLQTLYFPGVCGKSTTGPDWCSLATHPKLSSMSIITKNVVTFYDNTVVATACPTVAAKISSSDCT